MPSSWASAGRLVAAMLAAKPAANAQGRKERRKQGPRLKARGFRQYGKAATPSVALIPLTGPHPKTKVRGQKAKSKQTQGLIGQFRDKQVWRRPLVWGITGPNRIRATSSKDYRAVMRSRRFAALFSASLLAGCSSGTTLGDILPSMPSMPTMPDLGLSSIGIGTPASQPAKTTGLAVSDEP